MFYQNNNDYMRDAFYYTQPQQTSTYPYGGMNNNYSQSTMPMNANTFGNNMNTVSGVNSVSSMYPQVYRIIDPVASRVIANNNYPYYTEDNLNNMVDTVYNIVEGDVSTLSSSINQGNSGDDTVTQGPSRNTSSRKYYSKNNYIYSRSGFKKYS